MKILLAEDDSRLRKNIVHILKKNSTMLHLSIMDKMP